MASNKSEDDFNVTRQELNDIKEAFKKEEFRKLLNNYFEEVNDPKNKAIFQDELTKLERQRGIDVTFINPEPGYVIKSSIDGKKKAFINICSNEFVNKPTCTVSKDGPPGLNWATPYLQGQPRDELDKKNVRCTVYDVVFHPDTLYLAKKNVQIKKLVDDIALSAVEDVFKVKLDRKNLCFPKLNYKGCKAQTIIRKRREDFGEKKHENDIIPGYPYPYEPPPEKEECKVTIPRGNFDDEDTRPYTTPKYILKQMRDIDLQEFTDATDAKFHCAIPTNIIVEIDLPLVKSATDVNLDVVDKCLSLISEKPAKYKLEIKLPYLVDDEQGNAKFDKKLKKLIVTLPVKRCKIPRMDFFREDSGIESDVNQNNCSSSEEDIRKNIELLQVNNDIVTESSNDITTIRTSEEVKTEFLKSDFHYSLPINTVTLNENVLSLKMVVKNIDPHSVAHKFLGEGVHIKFSSLGAGFFPVYYSFCLHIPGIFLDTTSLKIDVWDNCLTATMVIKSDGCDHITSYFVGTSLESLEEKEINMSSSEISTLGPKELKLDGFKPSKLYENEFLNTTKTGSNKIQIDNTSKILNENNNENQSVEDKQMIGLKSTDGNYFMVVDNKSTNTLLKSRTLSESSEIPDSTVSGKRSILKGSRSLSESHTDDYNAWSSLDSGSHDDLVSIKKTVTFSDVVSRKIFRANSSILGQRKKNEKKSRNRKKAAYERMLSAGSEESETDRDEFDSVSELSSELSDVSSDDNGSGKSSENTIVPPSKRHRRRGAKNQRKAASTAKHNHLSDSGF